MKMELHDDIQKLGESGTKYTYDGADKTLLEAFPNPFSLDAFNPNAVVGSVNIVSPEFTSLCPKTGQPDFATIIVDYVPRKLCVESKSWKMYLGSFRQSGEFHESVICRICNDLVELLDPEEIRVKGEFTPRGGIPFWPTASWRRANG